MHSISIMISCSYVSFSLTMSAKCEARYMSFSQMISSNLWTISGVRWFFKSPTFPTIQQILNNYFPHSTITLLIHLRSFQLLKTTEPHNSFHMRTLSTSLEKGHSENSANFFRFPIGSFIISSYFKDNTFSGLLKLSLSSSPPDGPTPAHRPISPGSTFCKTLQRNRLHHLRCHGLTEVPSWHQDIFWVPTNIYDFATWANHGIRKNRVAHVCLRSVGSARVSSLEPSSCLNIWSIKKKNNHEGACKREDGLIDSDLSYWQLKRLKLWAKWCQIMVERPRGYPCHRARSGCKSNCACKIVLRVPEAMIV